MQTEQYKTEAVSETQVEIYNFTGRRGRGLSAQFTHSLTPPSVKDPLKRTGGCFMHRPPLAVGRFLRGVDKKQGGEREGTGGGRSNEGQWFDISPCHRHGVASSDHHHHPPTHSTSSRTYLGRLRFVSRLLSPEIIADRRGFNETAALSFPPSFEQEKYEEWNAWNAWHSNVIQRDIYRSSRQPKP